MRIIGSWWVGISAAAVFAAFLVPGFGASAQDAKKTPPAKAAASCKGLDEKSCKGKTVDCTWIVPKKGKQKAYCRLKPAKKA